MTVCNMSIEGGARCGYVNPDETTFEYLKGRPYAPKGEACDRAVAWWTSLACDADAEFDDLVVHRRRRHRTDRHLGHQPGAIGRRRHEADSPTNADEEALDLHGLRRRAARSTGTKIDVAFIGSCTNGRFPTSQKWRSSSRAGTWRRTSRRWSCPARRRSAAQAEAMGLDKIFTDAGFEWRGAGCSMCLAMNPDKLDRRPDLRVVVEPQLQGPPGQPDRPHTADEPGDGRGRGRSPAK